MVEPGVCRDDPKRRQKRDRYWGPMGVEIQSIRRRHRRAVAGVRGSEESEVELFVVYLIVFLFYASWKPVLSIESG